MANMQSFKLYSLNNWISLNSIAATHNSVWSSYFYRENDFSFMVPYAV